MTRFLQAIFDRTRGQGHPPIRGGNTAGLLLGDEGYRVACIGRSGAINSHFAPAGQNGMEEICDWLKSAAIKRVRLISDQSCQSYSREELPSANRRDRQKIVARNLNNRFGESAMTVAVELRATAESPEPQSPVQYLFASLAESANIESWHALLRTRQIEIAEVGLLPLEWANCLARTLLVRGDTGRDKIGWQVVVTRHMTGGFRHIVLSGGQLIVTRLTEDPFTPRRNGDDYQASGNRGSPRVFQEIEASVAYIRRFGYTSDQSLQVILVGGCDLVESVADVDKLSAHQWLSLSVSDVLERLQLKASVGSSVTGSDYADSIIAAWASGAELRYPLSSPTWKDILKDRHSASLANAAILAAWCLILVVTSWTSIELTQSKREMAVLDEELGKLSREADLLEIETKNFPDDLESFGILFREIDNHFIQNARVHEIYPSILKALGHDIRLARLVVETDGSTGEHSSRPLNIRRLIMDMDLSRLSDEIYANTLVDQFLSDIRFRAIREIKIKEVKIIVRQIPILVDEKNAGTWRAGELRPDTQKSMIGTLEFELIL